MKYGLVIFGDYEPLSVATVDRKYFTADPILFQDVFKSINCQNGGIIKNAVQEGMVAALEVIMTKKLGERKITFANYHVCSYMTNIKRNWMVKSLFDIVS